MLSNPGVDWEHLPNSLETPTDWHYRTVLLWNLELLDRDILLRRACEWVHDYLKTNPNVTNEDRHLCDDIGTSRSHNTDSKSTATLM
jgi:hypothetical protein